MSSNGTDSGGGGGGGNNDTVNYVALVVSLVALVGTVAQVLQQYYASAAGFSNCHESVVGLWSTTAERIFRPTELRFEVRFQAPVIFVCPPTNKAGPVKGAPIDFVDGTPESYDRTKTLPPGEEEKKKRQSAKERGVHTADNERATWVTLLSELHKMEKESREWQDEFYQKVEFEQDEDNPIKAELAGHTLAVALQAKQRSWDTMPAGVKKPYATTTICHMLEIAAMMGLYWKEFDRSKDRYRAEGNGFILTGTQINDLGLMFTFQISGGSKFQENRVIPADEVKELCCGSVSTLFRADKDSRRLGVLNEDPRDLGILQLGSMNEISETMVLIDCNTITASYFRNKDAKHGHLFPVPFELLGMLCKNLHIGGTPFRMVPNPTPYHWDKKFFNLRKLLNEYYKRIKSVDGVRPIPQIIETAERVVKEMANNKKRETDLRREEQERLIEKQEEIQKEKDRRASLRGSIGRTPADLRPVIEAVTQTQQGSQPAEKPPGWWQKLPVTLPSISPKGLKAQKRDEESQTPVSVEKGPTPEPQIKADDAKTKKKGSKSRPGYTIDLLNTLDEAIADCDYYLLGEDRALVRTVLREHFQEVLKLINGADDDDDAPIGSGKSEDGRRKARKFEELRAASPEDRQRKFMDIYFGDILGEVKKRAATSLSKMTFYHRRPYLKSPSPSMSHRAALFPPPDVLSGDPSDAESDSGLDSKEKVGRLEPRAAAIWCVLIFRMLCWLTLHDFDKNDVQVPKSELLGSRLPVYIS